MRDAKINIVVLGAGYGGIAAALRLAKLFKNNRDYKIRLIDRNPYHTLKTQLHEAAIEKGEVAIPIERIIARKNITFHCGEVKKIDVLNKKIFIEDNVIRYNFLVIALGSKSNSYNINGLESNAFTLQTYEDAQKIYTHIAKICASASSEETELKRKEKLRFIIGGGGLAGVEFTAELADHIRVCIGRYEVNNNEPEIYLIEAAEKILPSASEQVRLKIEKKLQRKDVKILTNTKIVKVEPDKVYLSNDNALNAKTIIWTGGIRISKILKESDLETGSMGRIIVDEYLRAKSHINVYAIGDNALSYDPMNKRPVPAAAQFALQQGRIVAQNIFNQVYGKELYKYKPKVWGEFISLGKHLAVGWLSLPFFKKIIFAGFLARLLKTAITEKHIFLLRKESRNWITY